MTNIPEPIGPMRNDCRMVAAPLTTNIAKTAQATLASEPSTALTRTMGKSAIGATTSSADWTPSPSASKRGGLSSGSYWGIREAEVVVMCVGGAGLQSNSPPYSSAGARSRRAATRLSKLELIAVPIRGIVTS